VPGAGRFFVSVGDLLLSLILGAAALALSLFFLPDTTLKLHRWARSIGDTPLSAVWPPHYEGVMRAITDERLIVYMGFVLASRIVVGLIMLLGSRWIAGRGRQEDALL
jgi:hypothetical protein